MLSSNSFYYETDHTECEILLGGWHCSLVGLVGFNSCVNATMKAWATHSLFIFCCCLFIFFPSKGWYCGVGVCGLKWFNFCLLAMHCQHLLIIQNHNDNINNNCLCVIIIIQLMASTCSLFLCNKEQAECLFYICFNVCLSREDIFFIICFYAIMHGTTIVQNKISIIICSCLFFCPANIYRPSLGKVRLGRPNPKLLQPLNFYCKRKRKKPILLRIVCTTMYRSLIFNFDFHLF